MAVVEAPDGADGDSELLLAAKPVANLLKRQIGLIGHEIEQPLLVRLERRATVASAGFRRNTTRSEPAIEPTHRRREARLSRRATSRRLSPSSTIATARSRKSFE